jgi:hypothetical protein
MGNCAVNAQERRDKISEAPSDISPIKSERCEEKCPCQKQQGSKPSNRIWRDWTNIEKFTSMLVVFTGIYAVGFIYEMYVTQRAYVVAKSADDNVRDLQVGKIPWVQMTMDNDRHTPTYHVKGTQVLEIVTEPLPAQATFKQGPIGENEVTIFPNAPLGMPTTEAHPLTDTELNGIKSGIYRACAWGDMQYHDAFGMSHYTNFCLCYSSTPPAAYCPYHNDAD